MINFSIVKRPVNANLIEINKAKARIKAAKDQGTTPDPQDTALVATEVQKAYAVAQYADVMTIEKFARHISNHGTVYSRADISAILYLAVDCMRELLLEGKKIQLGDLGDFSLSIQSKGADSVDKFTAQNITGLKVVWDCGASFRNLLPEAEFNLVASRSAQAAILRAIKTGESNVDLAAKPDGSGSSTTKKYSITVTSANSSMGSASGSATGLVKGTVVTISATPNSGYKFTQWNDGSTQNPRSIVVDSDKTFTAQFASSGSSGGFGA